MTTHPLQPSDHSTGPWRVERLQSEDGTELSVIRHADLWVPAPLALRYALEMRKRIGPGSLYNELREICVIYHWAEQSGLGFLEDHLSAGGLLDQRQLGRLKQYLHSHHPDQIAGQVTGPGDRSADAVSPGVFNRRLAALFHFLEWAIEPWNHGGVDLVDDDQRDRFLWRLQRSIRKWRESEDLPERAEPLTPEEVRLCRRAIAPDRFGRFRSGFDDATRFRNWAMFEFALNYGPRISEILLARTGHLPDFSDPEDRRVSIEIPRQQSVPDAKGQRGKTARLVRVPPMDANALRILRAYRTTPAPAGRLGEEVDKDTDRLFVRRHPKTRAWGGLSSSRGFQVFATIGRHAWEIVRNDRSIPHSRRSRLEESLNALAPHRLRHTWAEQTAYALYRKYGEEGFHRLKTWGGWRTWSAMEHYCQYARARIDDENAEAYFNEFAITK